VNKLADRYEHSAEQQQCCSSDVELALPACACATVGTKALESASRDVCCGTGVSSRRIARSNSEIPVVLDALELTLVNCASVVAPGCGCCVGNDLGLATVNSEGKSRFDFVYLRPADGRGDERINDRDSFVENQYSWVNEEQPNENQASHDERKLREPVAIAIEKYLHGKQQVIQNDNAGHNPCGCGAKAKEIGHKSILAVSVKTPLKVGK